MYEKFLFDFTVAGNKFQRKHWNDVRDEFQQEH